MNPEDDTVEVVLDPSARPPLRYRAAESASMPMSERYAGLLGRNSAWWWLLRNQHQYEDGFQIELGAASSTTTLQYLAMASRLHLRHVIEAVSPAEPLPPSPTP
ncbi:hypothetical protein GCM10010172_73000 [Paractinoplanes ferrugineus]|uniref:Uncharacterized protein n=1 Tax=Paractinoplanes ferrugineus TaxID=113564 RepID=A0A919IZ82_9ACTN|nr:DUF6334 family protein [Actinoplanes ferrugineus]GIE11545.1 hypothetical protein Afe05nite_33850 [Actinoplanes ferrugineus]